MQKVQPGILAPVPRLGRYLFFALAPAPADGVRDSLRRLAGLDDGITDALFRISKPVTSASFWCPPLRDGRLDLCRLGC